MMGQVNRQAAAHVDPDAPEYRERRGRSKRRDTKRWCRGKAGVEHRVQVVSFKDIDCREWSELGKSYLCFHENRCAECGRRLGFIKPQDCPDRKESS